MSRIVAVLILLGITGLACASRSGGLHDVDAVTEIGWDSSPDLDPATNAEAVLERYSVDFKIPNPLLDAGVSTRRIDPSHESQIHCRATLLDSISTEADIEAVCRRDSLDTAGKEEYRRNYLKEHVHPGRFRIRIDMESGFSEKSIDPEHWVIYLVDAKGVMIEPVQVSSSMAGAVQDSVYSSFHRLSLPRTRIHGQITLSFDRVTFFKEDLLGKANPVIFLEIVHEKETVARVAWKNRRAEKKEQGAENVRTER